MDHEALLRIQPVPYETIQKYILYVYLLGRWQRSINLIGPASEEDVWHRHIVDSFQLAPHVPEGARILDIGSGAGFPGLVLAMALPCQVTLVESDRRKGTFLSEVMRETQTYSRLLNARIETLSPDDIGPVDVITARACAPLDTLCTYALPFLQSSTFCLFPKGKSWDKEIDEARKYFAFDYEAIPSVTDAEARILHLRNLRRIGP